ncbi:MAG: GWxTD domain-containing protein [Clostridiales bacterium]|nr:GWxTD domain-containing protein [Clostridiales bacterium]
MSRKGGLIFIFCSFILSCAILPAGRKLDPDHKEFLSKVRYIITSQERKTFLNLPPSERQAFVEEFWKKRDQDPDTDVNEYREEYYRRIDTANRLFKEGGHSGWLQDRGRIYILLGPPEQRETYPRGYGFYDPPMEIWHYGFYKLIFVDFHWNGNFELQPQSARMLAEINVAQMQLRPELRSEKALSDFSLDVKKTSERELILLISIPYKDIWFSVEGEEFKTTLEVSVEVYDASDKMVREETKSFPLSLDQKELEGQKSKDYLIEILVQLDPGKYRAAVTLKNLTEKTRVRKNIELIV